MFVVYWHNVLPESLGAWDDTLPRVTAESFEKQVSWISRHFSPLDLADLLNPARSLDPSRRHLAITFDDGFRGVKDYALPVLEKLGWTGTLFVLESAGKSSLMHAERLEIAFRITSETSFNEQALTNDTERSVAYRQTKVLMRPMNPAERDSFCDDIANTLKVKEDDIRSFADDHPETYAKLSPDDCEELYQRGWTIGSHTRHHPHLTQLKPTELRPEIGAGDSCLEKNHLKYFAYPYGDCDDRIAAEVRSAGYDAAFTTESARIPTRLNPFLIPRMSFGGLWTRARKKFPNR